VWHGDQVVDDAAVTEGDARDAFCDFGREEVGGWLVWSALECPWFVLIGVGTERAFCKEDDIPRCCYCSLLVLIWLRSD